MRQATNAIDCEHKSATPEYLHRTVIPFEMPQFGSVE